MNNEKLEMMLKIFTEKRYKSEKVTDEKFMGCNSSGMVVR